MMEVHPAISPFSPSRFLLSMPDRACSLQSVVVKKGRELLFSSPNPKKSVEKGGKTEK